MALTQGIGKKSQDWSYLTPKRAIAVQAANVTDPSSLSDDFTINTLLTRDGKLTDRARQQTLVIFVIPRGVSTLASSTVLHLWSNADWAEKCAYDESSSSAACQDVGEVADILAKNRWALAEAATHSNIHAASFSSAMCFSFPWLPAGIYRAAVATGLTGSAVIAEQHTE